VRQFFWGALAVAAVVAGLFFSSFWRASRDRLFLLFSLAFWVLAVHWTALGIVNPALETTHYLYLLRLVAFVLIIVAIVDKNRRSGTP
jgi:type II secretory pathway component PulM